jgi:hypothetical protein
VNHTSSLLKCILGRSQKLLVSFPRQHSGSNGFAGEEETGNARRLHALVFARSVNDRQIGEAILNWKVVHEMRYILPNHKDSADCFLAATAMPMS